MPRIATVLAALVAAVLLSTPTAGASAPPPPVRYAALGDSAAAAPGVPEEEKASGLCQRSTHNYPHLVAERLAPAAFKDVTCTGADTATLASDGQFDALTKDTTLVTLTIGGNDIGFTEIIVKCSALGLLNPLGRPCADSYGSGLDDRVKAAEPKVAAALRTIHQRSPGARVLLVGYLNLIPDDGRTCRPRVMFTSGDMVFLNTFENSLNVMFARVAAAEGAVFVDNHPASADRDVCRADDTRWSEGLIPTNPAIPFHPNARGERAMADAVLAAARA
ncbi:SGNH/GDSL hydrolase family protein [Streptomyces sp. H10-C2]|uniref:SGNH/GDSL hydrolase family protein n=1 Tax=unclassified Streptomyces TaxID=2593676 RepID=UPI0024B972D7|nr:MULTISPECIES: SGNH/GDSL hydrolase family protein [unclassified Streptomyces]MDJ0340302.1 SGNH/GDSL hydrolase family protein [Streptomyces sp. PH10-H1]MDJ0368250.1 SGNH/GDSL hydrolase family protein [Streptomyces sp. H10-C2]